MLVKVKVLKSTACNDKATGQPNGDFITKIEHVSEQDAFGNRVKRLFYVPGKAALAVDTVLEIETDMYDIKPRKYNRVDDATGEVREYTLNYMYRRSDVAGAKKA